MSKRRIRPLYTGNRLHAILDRIGADHRLDDAADALARVTRVIPRRGPVKDALSGTWLDHPLHPMLTDLPIGFWTSAWVLDIVGGERDRDAARRLVGAGVLCAIPTAVSGAADWSDTEDSARRVGVVHAVVNSGAIALYTASWIARRRGRTGSGIALAWAGATCATVGGFLGGHLLAALGVGVDRTAFEGRIDAWTPAGDATRFSERPTRVEVNGIAVLVTRRGDAIHAIDATCPHRGAPLDEGTVADGVVTCPWHGSRFNLRTGKLLAGPSPTGVGCYRTRIRAGNLEIRSRPPG